ncbi:HutD family protein [Rahnella victoriana]|uniref:HutD family protein n=1 Tax=Rahnella victoriana TaxID=1510570 RepID=A0ABS0DQ77_9GAMM|nr:HutD family protein [Rahnella victoriana]MBF7955770.1 HutD family protein [Rahnella victoriana]
MKGWQYFSFNTLPVSPWRNGGGETREIISFPPGKSEFDWRASIATIAQDGPFSAFPGIDRSITLLSGEGVYLQANPDVNHRLDTTGEPFAFSGDIAFSARLLGGVTTDFNIMTRRACCAAQVKAAREALRITRENGGVVYVISGVWRLPDGTEISAGEGGYWSEPATQQGEDFVNLVPLTHPDHCLLLWASITD